MACFSPFFLYFFLHFCAVKRDRHLVPKSEPETPPPGLRWLRLLLVIKRFSLRAAVDSVTIATLRGLTTKTVQRLKTVCVLIW